MKDSFLNYDQKPSVVLVDDDELVLNSIKNILRRQFTVIAFSNPFEAEAFFHTAKADILLSDERMPGMKGSELVKKVHELQPDTIKIILSGQAEKEDIAKAVNDGHIFAFLFKPAYNQQLIQTLHRGIEHKKMREKIFLQKKELEDYNKELEKKVEERTERLLAMEKFYEVGKFSASIVHNLNNPLQMLYLSVQMMEMELNKGNDISNLEKYIDKMYTGMENIEKLIKSITASVRTSEYERNTELNINGIITSSLEFVKINKNLVKNLSIDTNLNQYLKPILGQEIHFTQIFSNLFKNAIDAMESSVEKRLKVYTDNDGDESIIIKISDTGCGIKKENLDKIFSTDYTSKPPGKGTGLGLPITKQMVESYKGTIEVESEPGNGTTFIVSFPLENQ